MMYTLSYKGKNSVQRSRTLQTRCCDPYEHMRDLWVSGRQDVPSPGREPQAASVSTSWGALKDEKVPSTGGALRLYFDFV